MFDREKFKRLVHYVIAQAGHREGFGAVKLNKVLWFAEARHYMLKGEPIAGADYLRQEFGPVPRGILAIRQELADEGKIQFWPPRQAFEGWRFKSLQPADRSAFTGEELQNVDYWIKHIADDHTAGSISEESHDYAWEIAKMGEPLPLYAAFANRIREPNDEEMEWARDAAKRAGLK